jgi:hypothetical protein
MFMFVTYPWPVTSAHVELTGPQLQAAAAIRRNAIEGTVENRARHLEEIVCWTDRERLRFQWYRLRLAVRDILSRIPQGSR